MSWKLGGPAVEYHIRIDGDDEGHALLSLYRWLTQDSEVARRADIRLETRASTQTSEMGGTFDAIMAVLNDGMALGSLVLAYLSWRGSRSQPPEVSIECDGLVVNLTGSSPEALGRVIEALTEQAGQ